MMLAVTTHIVAALLGVLVGAHTTRTGPDQARRTTATVVIAILLALTWWGHHWVQTAARAIGIVILIVVALIAWRGTPLRWIGQATAWLALSRQSTVDWPLLTRAATIITIITAAALAPAWAWTVPLTLALALTIGTVLAHTAARLPQHITTITTAAGRHSGLLAALAFRLRYKRLAVELGWDKGRRGNSDRQPIPQLLAVRRSESAWHLRFMSRGDWDRAEWDTQGHALRRRLTGTFVHCTHHGPEVSVVVFTAPLPLPGAVTITDAGHITSDGILIGQDASGTDVRWAADHQSAHGLLVGPPGSGKSYLCALMLLQAAQTTGWCAEILDGKQTRSWDWLTAHGVTVIRDDRAIRARLRALEAERKRIEDTGQVTVTRLVILDEARMIVGQRTGRRKQLHEESAEVLADLTGLGRSAGLRVLVAIQRPDVTEIGGGYLRANLVLRVALGRLGSSGRLMLFDDRTVTDDELEILDGTVGRGIASGLRGGDADGTALQVPALAIPGMPTDTPADAPPVDRDSDPAPDPPPTPRHDDQAPPTADQGPTSAATRRPGLDPAAVAAAVPPEGCTRTDIATRLGVRRDSRALRTRLDELITAGVLAWSPATTGRPGIVTRGKAWQSVAGSEAAAGERGEAEGHPPTGGGFPPRPATPTATVRGPDTVTAAA